MSNEDKAKPENKITIGGKEYDLVFNFGFLRKIQRLTGKEVNPFSPSFVNNPGPMEVHAILWALLRTKNPTISEYQVDEIFDNLTDEEVAAFGEAVETAKLQSQGDASKKKGAPIPKSKKSKK